MGTGGRRAGGEAGPRPAHRGPAGVCRFLSAPAMPLVPAPSRAMTRPDPPEYLPPRLIVVDPGLRSALGHNLGYSVAVAQAARARGIAPLVLASREFQGRLPDGIPCRPSFTPVRPSDGGGALRRTLFGLAAHLPSLVAAHVVPPARALRRALRRPAAERIRRAAGGRAGSQRRYLARPSAAAHHLRGQPDGAVGGGAAHRAGRAGHRAATHP